MVCHKNGGFMKQLPKSKWILSTLLVAALGSQYYFSASSKNIGEVDMSSYAVTLSEQQIQSLSDLTTAIQAAKNASGDSSLVSADLSVVVRQASADLSAAKPASSDASVRPVIATQAAAPTICADCVQLSRAEAERLKQILLEVTGKKEQEKKEPVIVETAAEKRKREREEKAEAKRLAAEEKAEKLRDEKLARHEEFADRAEEMADKCQGEVSCLTSGYSSLLLRFSGKKKIDLSIAQAAFRKHIDPHLKAALADPSKSEAAVEALNSITRDIPVEYRAVKETAINTVKSVVSQRAISANSNFRLAEQLSKANKISESLSVGQQAEQDAQEFSGMANLYSSTINSSLQDVSDSVTQLFMKNNFTPEVSKLFMNMRLTNQNLATTVNNGTTTNPLTNPAQTTRGVVRGGDTTVNNGVTQQTTTNPSTGNMLNGVQFGTPQQGTRGNGRTAY